MPNTFELIASSTLGAAASSIGFTSIPATYTDLCLKLSIRSASGSTMGTVGATISINGSTANRTVKRIYGNGTSAVSDSPSALGISPNTSTTTASTFTNLELYFPNYAGSTNKSFSVDSVSENNATLGDASLVAQLWSQTAAINALSFAMSDSSNLVQYSTAYLYGVKNA